MNEFKLLGRVGKLDIEFKDNDKGTVIATISLGVKNAKGEYENFWITFFNTKKKDLAEILADTVKEGDYIRVNGKLSINKFIPDGADKPKYQMRLIGWGFKKVRWDEEKRTYVDECPDEEDEQG